MSNNPIEAAYREGWHASLCDIEIDDGWQNSDAKANLGGVSPTMGQIFCDENGKKVLIGFEHSAQKEIERLNDELTCGSEAFEAVSRERDEALERLNELDHCMCGGRMDGHDIGSGHSPVSMYEYHQDQLIEEVERLREQLQEVREYINERERRGD